MVLEVGAMEATRAVVTRALAEARARRMAVATMARRMATRYHYQVVYAAAGSRRPLLQAAK